MLLLQGSLIDSPSQQQWVLWFFPAGRGGRAALQGAAHRRPSHWAIPSSRSPSTDGLSKSSRRSTGCHLLAEQKRISLKHLLR